MALSDHEQHVLEQMERALASEDPRFANVLRGVPVVRKAQQSLGASVLAILLGVAGLIAGVATAIPAIGILGFLLTVGAIASALANLRPVAKGRTPRQPRTSFMQGLEERWDRRDS